MTSLLDLCLSSVMCALYFSTAYKCRCTRKGPKIRYKDVQKLEIKPKHPFCQEKMILWVRLILFQCVTLHMSFLHFLVSLSAFFLSSYSYFTFFFLLNPLTFSYLLTCVPCFSPFPLVIHPLFLPACTLHMLWIQIIQLADYQHI